MSDDTQSRPTSDSAGHDVVTGAIGPTQSEVEPLTGFQTDISRTVARMEQVLSRSLRPAAALQTDISRTVAQMEQVLSRSLRPAAALQTDISRTVARMEQVLSRSLRPAAALQTDISRTVARMEQVLSRSLRPAAAFQVLCGHELARILATQMRLDAERHGLVPLPSAVDPASLSGSSSQPPSPTEMEASNGEPLTATEALKWIVAIAVLWTVLLGMTAAPLRDVTRDLIYVATVAAWLIERARRGE